MEFFPYMGFLLILCRKYTELETRAWSSSNPTKRWRWQDNRTCRASPLLPSSSSKTKSVATVKNLVSYRLEATVYEQVLIPLNSVRTNVTSQKMRIIATHRLLQATAKADWDEKREWNSDVTGCYSSTSQHLQMTAKCVGRI